MEDGKKDFYRPPQVFNLVKELNEYTKNIGTVALLIKYQATPGNLKTHEEFLKFAFEEANNEYMVAIGKLLTFAKLSERLDSIEHRLNALEVLTLNHVEDCNKEEDVVDEGQGSFTKTF